MTAEGVDTNGIIRRTGQSKTCGCRWQECVIEQGFDGLLRCMTRPSSIELLGAEAAECVVAEFGGPFAVDLVAFAASEPTKSERVASMYDAETDLTGAEGHFAGL